MSKITANDAHRHDDICDTLYDGVKIALIDKSLHNLQASENPADAVMNTIALQMRRQQALRMNRDGIR
jgi:hypothetical protein